VSNHPFRPLRHRSVRLLWGAAVVSDTGTWVQLIVVGSLVASNTGSAVQTALIALATFAPQGLASPVGGLLADRFDRRVVFRNALLVQAAITTVLALVVGAGVREPAVLAGLILLASGAGAVGAPSYSAMIPDLVPPDELVAMVSLGIYSWNAGRIIGPVVGSLLALTIGPAWTVAVNAATFVVLAMAVWMVRQRFVPLGADGTVVERLRGGWDALRSTPGCWYAVVLLVVYNITAVPFMGLMPIYAQAVHDGGTSLTGALSSAQGIGAIVGGVVLTMLSRRVRRSVLLAALVAVLCVVLTVFALAPTPASAVAVALFLGAAAASMFVTTSAIIQRDAPPASRGRVMAMMQASMGFSYGFGLLFIGALGDLTSLRVAYVVGAVSMAVGSLILARRATDWRQVIDGVAAPTVEPSLATAR
jgi:MFS family permease